MAGVVGPRRRTPDLGETVEGDVEELVAGADLEGARFGAVTVEDAALGAATYRECVFEGVRASGARWRGSRWVDCVVERLDAATLELAASTWQQVEVNDSRFGAASCHDATWESVLLRGCKVDFLNLRAATLTDVEIVGCTIAELDLTDATARRIAFRDTRIGMLVVRGATLEAVDLRGAVLSGLTGVAGLRGAVVDEVQLAELAPLLADELGLQVG